VHSAEKPNESFVAAIPQLEDVYFVALKKRRRTMLGTIFNFELKRWFKNPSFYIYMAIFFSAFYAYNGE
jgi:hypothetical protein